MIGVVLFTGYEHPDIHHPFFQEVLVGLKHGIGELGYDLLLFATEQPGSSHGRPHSYLRRAQQHQVDGIVLMGVDRTDPEVEKLVRSSIPVIAVDLDVVGDHTSFVASDNIGGARLAVRHLYDLGHTRIANVAGPSGTKPGADRTLGYRAEMRELGLKIVPGYEVEGDFYAESGETAMRVDARAGRAANSSLRRGRHDGRGSNSDGAGGGPVRAEGRGRRRVRRHPRRRAPLPASDHGSTGHGRHRTRRRPCARRTDREPRFDTAGAHVAGRAGRPGVLRLRPRAPRSTTKEVDRTSHS